MARSSPDDVVRERVRELLGDGPLSLKVVVDELDGAAALDSYREEGVPDGKLGEEVIEILGLAPGSTTGIAPDLRARTPCPRPRGSR